MADRSPFLQKRYGESANPLAQGQQFRRGLRALLSEMHTQDTCLVYDYRPATQRVDVILKNVARDRSPIIRDVPIAFTNNAVMFGGGLRTVVAGDDRPTVGEIHYPRIDGRESYEHHVQQKPLSNQHHQGLGPIFVPGGLVRGATMPTIKGGRPLFVDENPDADQVGPDDAFLVERESGSHIIIKRDSKKVIVRGFEVVLLGDGQDLSDAKTVARDGDSVTSGTVDASSTKVKAG